MLGVAAFDAVHGAAANDEAEAAINRLLCERVVVAADSGKPGQRAFARICGVKAVDTLVTDAVAGADAVRPFEETSIRVITA